MTTTPMSPTIPDADPVETAAAVATTMRRLVAETNQLTDLNQAPQITKELLDALRQVAEVTSRLSDLAFKHPLPVLPTGSDPDVFGDRSDKPQVVNSFTDATHRIYLACQPLASAKNAATRLIDQTPPDITAEASDAAPVPTGREPRGLHRPEPHRGHPHRSEPAPTPAL